MSGSIKEKYQKILWARAAGRCSMPDCRVVLTLDTDASAVTLGAMCHIVGEKPDSARWNDSLSDEARNSYSNLILLCSHHHDSIDKSAGAYPIERLHQLKAEHEEWVQGSLAEGGNLDPDDLVYADLVDCLTVGLFLHQWDYFIDDAVRNILPREIFGHREMLNRRRLGAIFPERFPDLDASIREAVMAYSALIDHFDSRAELRRDGRYGRNLDYKRHFNRRYHEEVDNEQRWAMHNFWLLCDLTLKINRFCSAVRAHINPMFFRLHGNFIVHDSTGHHFGGEPMMLLPTEDAVREGLEQWPDTRKQNRRSTAN